MQRSNARPTARRLRGALVALAVVPATGLQAQIPEEFTNLRVLPADVSRGELMGVMRGFAGALGVRCNFCHVGEDPNDFIGYDFASDEKEVKRVARSMMEMRGEINGRLLAATGRDDRLDVQCATCHRGVRRPISLTDEILEVIESDGVEAAEARYRELRGQYYGRAAYDFGQGSLNMVTETLARAGDLDGARAMIALNVEHNPDDHWPYMLQAQVLMQAGDREGAIASAERALELSPGNEFYEQQLERLRRAPGS